MSADEIVQWGQIMETWIIAFFQEKSFIHVRRLERRQGARNLDTDISFVSQNVSYNEVGIRINDVRYDQTIAYIYQEKGDLAFEESQEIIEVRTVEQLVRQPFGDEAANEALAVELRENVEGFEDVISPLDEPIVP